MNISSLAENYGNIQLSPSFLIIHLQCSGYQQTVTYSKPGIETLEKVVKQIQFKKTSLTSFIFDFEHIFTLFYSQYLNGYTKWRCTKYKYLGHHRLV